MISQEMFVRTGRCYMDLQDPQSTKYDAQRARAKLMEAAYTVSVVHGNHMTCSAGHAGTLALKAELTAVGDSPLAAAEAAGDGSKGLAERAGGLVAAARAAIEAAREATLPEECTAAELRALGRLKAVSRTIIAGFPCGSCTGSLVDAHRGTDLGTDATQIPLWIGVAFFPERQQ